MMSLALQCGLPSWFRATDVCLLTTQQVFLFYIISRILVSTIATVIDMSVAVVVLRGEGGPSLEPCKN